MTGDWQDRALATLWVILWTIAAIMLLAGIGLGIAFIVTLVRLALR